MSNKPLYQIALTHIKGVGITHARTLLKAMGNEETIFKGDIRNLKAIPRISKRLIEEIRNPDVLRKAEKELEFVVKNNIRLFFFTDAGYPKRLSNCIDAPIVLYAKGNTNFNHPKTVSIVGTRNSTRYGQEFSLEFVKDIAEDFPDVQIVSGLAYGIDICAHRAALQNGLSTVAVLAHGLDRIYPRPHRQTAIDMLDNGALLTEFPSETNPDRYNFVKRNRIVAGMSDAIIVIESAKKGGSLITADIGNSYFRDVFALPGRVNDKMSEGCNNLISDNKAILLHSTNQFVDYMGWIKSNPSENKAPRQIEIFSELSKEEQRVIDVLSKGEALQVNTLSIELNIPMSELFMILIELEIKELIKVLPGGMYELA